MKNGRVFPVAMPGELQITPFCVPQRMDAEGPAAAPNGGSRATVATSDHNAARLAFQGASDPIADSARLLLAFSP
jgi:hypothetical protein